MIDAALLLTIILTYGVIKKHASEIKEISSKSEYTHLRLFIVFGYICFILGQNFLLLSGAELIINVDFYSCFSFTKSFFC